MGKTFFIAAGGTGGHIYPGLAVAEALRKQDPNHIVHFIGTRLGLEQKIIGATDFPLHKIVAGKLNFSGRWLTKLMTLLKLPVSCLQSAWLLIRYRPAYVFGVGGFASGPMLLTAALLRFRTGIWEPNAAPGMANRYLARFVSDCFVVFEESKQFLKRRRFEMTGSLLREQFASNDSIREHQKEVLQLLIIGGSQGSQILNEALSKFLLTHEDHLSNRVRVTHQVGAKQEARYQAKYKGHTWIQAVGFINAVAEAYRQADFAISRSGAGSVAELACMGVPSIFIPLRAANAHQEKNAQALAAHDAAILVYEGDLQTEKFEKEFFRILNESDVREKLSQQIRRFYIPHSAEQVARFIAQ